VGTRSLAHINDAIAGADLELSAGVLARIDAIMQAAQPTAGPATEGSGRHQQPVA